MLGQPLPHLRGPRPLDVDAVPAGDNRLALGHDDQRRLVGPVVPGEIGEIVDCGRRAVNVANLGLDPDGVQNRLRLQAELTALFGEYLENQNASSSQASQTNRAIREINPAFKRLTSRASLAGIPDAAERTRPPAGPAPARRPGLTLPPARTGNPARAIVNRPSRPAVSRIDSPGSATILRSALPGYTPTRDRRLSPARQEA